jgi:hypothetical protein
VDVSYGLVSYGKQNKEAVGYGIVVTVWYITGLDTQMKKDETHQHQQQQTATATTIAVKRSGNDKY